MKVVTAQEMTRLEQRAFQRGLSEEACMLTAGARVAEAIQGYIGRHHLRPHILLLCGRGNNAGDAYVAGKLLLEGGFTVWAWALAPLSESSPLCQLQRKRFVEAGGTVREESSLACFLGEEISLLVDGILGTGFHGEVQGVFREAILQANASGIPILSIDIASGIDGTCGWRGGAAIRADETCFLGFPKLGCFLGEAWEYTGSFRVLDFGLPPAYVDEAIYDFQIAEEEERRRWLPPIRRTRHKYEAGYVVGVGGSPGMVGAPILASWAALRTGAGIVRLFHPKTLEEAMSGPPWEVIRHAYASTDLSPVWEHLARATAVFVGPGMGRSAEALFVLQQLLPKVQVPCVIDADALALLADHSLSLPPQTILTPHRGEMSRLLGLESHSLPSPTEWLALCQHYAKTHNVLVILKGSPTFVFHPQHTPYIVPQGDPGMATAGSGDVLTGMVAAFLAQTKDPWTAALLAAHFHAEAGEEAAQVYTSYSMVASDLLSVLPRVFKKYGKCGTTHRNGSTLHAKPCGESIPMLSGFL